MVDKEKDVYQEPDWVEGINCKECPECGGAMFLHETPELSWFQCIRCNRLEDRDGNKMVPPRPFEL